MTLTVAARQLATPQTPTVVVTAGTLKSFTVNWSSVSQRRCLLTKKSMPLTESHFFAQFLVLAEHRKLVNATDFPAIADGTDVQELAMIATGDANNTELCAQRSFNEL
jgi:hypothetical protein